VQVEDIEGVIDLRGMKLSREKRGNKKLLRFESENAHQSGVKIRRTVWAAPQVYELRAVRGFLDRI
jgi:hypothetical protein